MARIANTFFEPKNGNRQYNAMANIPGVFQNAGSPDICPSGLLVTKLELLPLESPDRYRVISRRLFSTAGEDLGDEGINVWPGF